MYEKIELHIALLATYNNPYDPDDIDLWAEFTAPSGKVFRVFGFYNPSRNNAEWMVRFAPVEEGEWKYQLHVRDREGQADSDERLLRVAPNERHGFVRIAPNNRYFQYSDGASYYPVGLWFNDDYQRYGGGEISEEALDDLTQLGVNFISFYSTPLETRGTGLGRYDQNIAGRLDQIFEWCEDRDIHISWNLVFHSQIAENIWGPGNSWYRSSPYHSIAKAEDWFSSPEVWKHQQNLYRYIIARWGYSRALFLWFIVDEINGTEGFQGDDRVASAETWCQRMNDFFHEHDPYGRPTTGTQSGGLENWWPAGYKIFDVAGREIYEAQGHPMPVGKPDLAGDNPLVASYGNYAKQVQDLWAGFHKPAIIAESGWDHTYYEPGMPGYLAMYHNALWASLVNGASATPFWWAYSDFYLNDSLLTGQLRAFSRFVADIDFANRDWRPATLKTSAGDGWAMQSGEQIFGWLVNPVSGVANESFTVEGLPDGQYVVSLFRTWRGFYMPPASVASQGGSMTIPIPLLSPQEGRGQNIGDDVAFRITPRGDSQKTPRQAARQ